MTTHTPAARTGYTPGPWKIKRSGCISDSNGDLIATTGYRVAVGSDEDDFNARLIAAAPELLALARRVAEAFDGTDAPLGIQARAVIAKALPGEGAGL